MSNSSMKKRVSPAGTSCMVSMTNGMGFSLPTSRQQQTLYQALELAEKLKQSTADDNDEDERTSKRQFMDGFHDAQRGMLTASEKEDNSNLECYDGVQRTVNRKSSRWLGTVQVAPHDGHFSHGPVVVEMSTTANACVAEFETSYSVPEGWQRRVGLEPVRQPIRTYRRPLVLEEAGQWELRVRLRQVASDLVTEWQTHNFRIEQGPVPDQKFPVIRCTLRTQLDVNCMQFNMSSYNALQHAMKGAFGVPDLQPQVMQATFKWPQVDIHYTISLGWQHSAEEVLDKLRDSRLIPEVVDRLQLEGVQVRTGMTEMLGCAVRTFKSGRAMRTDVQLVRWAPVRASEIVCHPDGFLRPNKRKTEMSGRAIRTSSMGPSTGTLVFHPIVGSPTALDLCCLRSLFLQPGRVQGRALLAARDFDAGQWIECFFSLPMPLFKLAASFLEHTCSNVSIEYRPT